MLTVSPTWGQVRRRHLLSSSAGPSSGSLPGEGLWASKEGRVLTGIQPGSCGSLGQVLG